MPRTVHHMQDHGVLRRVGPLYMLALPSLAPPTQPTPGTGTHTLPNSSTCGGHKEQEGGILESEQSVNAFHMPRTCLGPRRPRLAVHHCCPCWARAAPRSAQHTSRSCDAPGVACQATGHPAHAAGSTSSRNPPTVGPSTTGTAKNGKAHRDRPWAEGLKVSAAPGRSPPSPARHTTPLHPQRSAAHHSVLSAGAPHASQHIHLPQVRPDVDGCKVHSGWAVVSDEVLVPL